MTTRYFIPAGPARAELRVSNSRFIAGAAYAPTVAAAKAFIAGLRAAMPDANHHVFGYVVGFGSSVTAGMSDDGEPGGTAGRPVLAVVRGSGLGDLCLVVTRYFGGTLLGTGGLVKAYGDAAKAVLAELPRIEKIERAAATLTLPYSLYEQAKLWLAAHSATITAEDFAAEVTLRFTVPVEELPALRRTLTERSSGQLTLTV